MKISWRWYDLWVGAYWDRKARVLYVCPIPTVLITICFHEWTEWLHQSWCRSTRTCRKCGKTDYRFYG